MSVCVSVCLFVPVPVPVSVSLSVGVTPLSTLSLSRPRPALVYLSLPSFAGDQSSVDLDFVDELHESVRRLQYHQQLDLDESRLCGASPLLIDLSEGMRQAGTQGGQVSGWSTRLAQRGLQGVGTHPPNPRSMTPTVVPWSEGGVNQGR